MSPTTDTRDKVDEHYRREAQRATDDSLRTSRIASGISILIIILTTLAYLFLK